MFFSAIERAGRHIESSGIAGWAGRASRARKPVRAGALLTLLFSAATVAVAQTPASAPLSDLTQTGAQTSALTAEPPQRPMTLREAIDGPQRTQAFRARDVYRHPFETLRFFDIRPNQVVVEIAPGAGWYTEILAPYLRGRGMLYEAVPQPVPSAAVLSNGASATVAPAGATRFQQKLAAHPDLYGQVVVLPFAPPAVSTIRPPGGADRVLTFRNVHDWMKAGTTRAVFAAMYGALKPGGILGVEEHRARPGTSVSQMIETGYVTERYVIAQAEAVGFRLEAGSEINANAKDDKQHPHGVWSLPPTLEGGDADRRRFLSIGESDRMTLRFVKP